MQHGDVIQSDASSEPKQLSAGSGPSRKFTDASASAEDSGTLEKSISQLAAETLHLVASEARRSGAGEWVAPHISVDEDEATFEWWKEERQLAVFVQRSGEVLAIKSWGTNVHSQMEEVQAPTPSELRGLWAWLIG